MVAKYLWNVHQPTLLVNLPPLTVVRPETVEENSQHRVKANAYLVKFKTPHISITKKTHSLGHSHVSIDRSDLERIMASSKHTPSTHLYALARKITPTLFLVVVFVSPRHKLILLSFFVPWTMLFCAHKQG